MNAVCSSRSAARFPAPRQVSHTSRQSWCLPILLACLAIGCAHSTASDKVPKDAIPITTAQAGPIAFVAPEKGTVYILDINDDRVISATPIEAGVKLLFNPQHLKTNHVHRLYFQKG